MCKGCAWVVTVELCSAECALAGTIVLAGADWDKIRLSAQTG